MNHIRSRLPSILVGRGSAVPLHSMLRDAGGLHVKSTGFSVQPRRDAHDDHVWTYQHNQAIAYDRMFSKPKRWPRYNEVIHRPEDGPVERYYCHFRDNIKYSPKKMYFVASFIRGMSIDEALKQLSYVQLKGGSIVKEVLLEAQDIAVREHNFEFRSKMWIAESFTTKGVVFRGYRKHARMRFGEIRYFHCHYYVRLVEGDPPAQYLPSQGPYPQLMTTEERLKQHFDKLRDRRIDYGL